MKSLLCVSMSEKLHRVSLHFLLTDQARQSNCIRGNNEIRLKNVLVGEVWPAAQPGKDTNGEDPVLYGSVSLSPTGSFQARSLQTFTLTYPVGRFGWFSWCATQDVTQLSETLPRSVFGKHGEKFNRVFGRRHDADIDGDDISQFC